MNNSSRAEMIRTGLMLGLPVIAAFGAGLSVFFLFPVLGFIGMVLGFIFVLGSGLVLIPKYRALRRNNWVVVFGPHNMTFLEKIYYLLGYLLIMFSVLCVIVVTTTGISLS